MYLITSGYFSNRQKVFVCLFVVFFFTYALVFKEIRKKKKNVSKSSVKKMPTLVLVLKVSACRSLSCLLKDHDN